MKKLSFSLLFLAFTLTTYGQVSFSIGSPYIDQSTGISLDARGNIYLTGTFQGSLDLDPGPGVNQLTAQGDPLSPDSQDVFVARYSSIGEFDWGFSISSPGRDMSYAIEVKEGFMYVCGYIQGETEFDPGPGSAVFNSDAGQDAFVAVYDTLGVFVWAQVLGDEEGAPFDLNDIRYEVAFDVSVDEMGNCYLAGAFTGTMDFEPDNSSPFDSFFSTADGNGISGRDIFVVSYDPAGNYRWGFGVGGTDAEQAQAIAHTDGAIFLGGQFSGTTDLNPSGQQLNLSSHGSTDAFLAKYQASDGTLDWAVGWGGIEADEVAPGAIALGKHARVVVGGNFQGMVTFDPNGNGQTKTAVGGRDVFLSQFLQDGSYAWTKTQGSTRDDLLTDVLVTTEDFSYLSGRVDDKLYLEQLDELGNSNWERELGGGNLQGDQMSGLALNQEEDVFFSGTFFQTLDIDPGVDMLLLNSVGESDICVGRYSPEGLLNRFGTRIGPGLPDFVSDLTLYPSPATDELSIRLELGSYTPLGFSIRNYLGQVVFEKQVEARFGPIQDSFPLTHLSSGAYWVEIRFPEGIYTEKFWKR